MISVECRLYDACSLRLFFIVKCDEAGFQLPREFTAFTCGYLYGFAQICIIIFIISLSGVSILAFVVIISCNICQDFADNKYILNYRLLCGFYTLFSFRLQRAIRIGLVEPLNAPGVQVQWNQYLRVRLNNSRAPSVLIFSYNFLYFFTPSYKFLNFGKNHIYCCIFDKNSKINLNSLQICVGLHADMDDGSGP